MNLDNLRYWPLDPAVTQLNHGGYGACLWPVLRAQDEWRARMERNPTRFMGAELEPALDDARGRLGTFLGADPDDLAFVPNATAGVNTVLRSLEPDLAPTDEILTTDHDYNACINAIRATAARTGARIAIAQLPFPPRDMDEVRDAILGAVTPRTRLAVISHVTSPTALVWPIAQIVAGLAERGVDTLVDGAHAPGIVPLDISAIGATYYTGNCHKWLCAPKGSGFLHVRRDCQARIHPLVTSHGANSPRLDRAQFRLEFDWIGTSDPTAYLSIPTALDFMAGLVDGGWPAIMRRNREMVLVGRGRLAESLGISTIALAPDAMIGSMATLELPVEMKPGPIDRRVDPADVTTYPLDPLRDALFAGHRIEVPVFAWPHSPADGPPRRLIRISAQLYNSADDYERLALALAGS